MESTNLTPLPPDRDPLEAWLSAKTLLASLPDEGFTTRVLAALPPPQSSFSWRQLLPYAAGALGGLAVAWWQGSSRPDPASIFSWWNGVSAQTVSLLGDPWWSLAFAGAIVAAAAVFAIRVAWAPLFEEDFEADF
jgi:hypothetical protein